MLAFIAQATTAVGLIASCVQTARPVMVECTQGILELRTPSNIVIQLSRNVFAAALYCSETKRAVWNVGHQGLGLHELVYF